ncbi:MAG: hypothetical protein NTV46_03955, partial [Verrucomicrobia bacterium]|nr:hypothetical protein [Verrucomicrobiota bacterium]
DIKETIAPPKKALIVDNESLNATKPVGDGDSTKMPASDGPLKAIPVESLDSDREPAPKEQAEAARPMRARPVVEEDVMEENVEQP